MKLQDRLPTHIPPSPSLVVPSLSPSPSQRKKDLLILNAATTTVQARSVPGSKAAQGSSRLSNAELKQSVPYTLARMATFDSPPAGPALWAEELPVDDEARSKSDPSLWKGVASPTKPLNVPLESFPSEGRPSRVGSVDLTTVQEKGDTAPSTPSMSLLNSSNKEELGFKKRGFLKGSKYGPATFLNGTVSGLLRLWRLAVWVTHYYTRFFVHCLRFYLGIYHGFRVLVDIYSLLAVHWIGQVGLLGTYRWLYRQILGGTKGRQITTLHRNLAKAQTYEEWRLLSEQLDEVTGAREWCQSDDQSFNSAEPRTISQSLGEDDNLLYDCQALRSHLNAMRSAREAGQISEIVFLLRVCCNRHFCHLRNPALYSVSFVRTKQLIEDFYDEVLTSLDYLNSHIIDETAVEDDDNNAADECNTDNILDPHHKRSMVVSDASATSLIGHKDGLTAREFLKFLSALRLSMGRTALCLSGGGALALYHMGIIKCLIENKMVPKVISGTSGGAITAGAMAVWSDNELQQRLLRPGYLEENGLVICPPFAAQLKHLWQTGYLLDQKNLIHLARSLYGEVTFSEAFQRTGRFVSITTVPAGRSGPSEPLVCNCINTPDILIWSAVVASCALPLVVKPMALFTKSRGIHRGLRPHAQRPKESRGRRHAADRAASPPSTVNTQTPSTAPSSSCEQCGTVVNNAPEVVTPVKSETTTRFVSDLGNVPIEGDVSRYAPESMLFVDGSILQDIPHTELQTLFNVKSFVVSQVNPHFTPFVQGPSGYRNQKGALRWALDQLWNYLALDLRNRYARLLALAVVPKIKGQDVSPFLMQSAEGHVTVCPAPPSDFWKITANFTSQDVERALLTGQRKLWPYFTRLKHVLVVENKLKELWVENLRRYESHGTSAPSGGGRSF